MDIVFVHGYNVTSTRTYGVLPQRLKGAGHDIHHVYLAKYVTLDNDIRMTDLVRAMQAALEDEFGAAFATRKFSCITHSTGALVARSWIDTYFSDNMNTCPVLHLIMLAPPTNGSRLAELGKSRLSRIRSLIGVEPGLKILDALELGSEMQWDLNSRWMKNKTYAAPGFYSFVIAGQWIDKKIWDVIVPATYERGSDGVVRASAANPNMQKIYFAPDGEITRDEISGVAFLIAPKTAHADQAFGIMSSVPEAGDHPVLTAILQALDVASADAYRKVEADFAAKTTQLQQTEGYHDGSHLDRYCQVVFRVTDNRGNRLSDYAIELVDGTGEGDQLPSGFLADKHQNEINPEFFVFYLDYDRMISVQGGKMGFKVQSVVDTPLIHYQETSFVGGAGVTTVVKPNQTVFIDVVMRRQINKNVFRLTENFAVEKIGGEAGDDWID